MGRASSITAISMLALAGCSGQLNPVSPGLLTAGAATSQAQTYLYVVNSPQKGLGSVSAFVVANAAVTQRMKIKNGISKPLAIELDGAGDLYVANANFATRGGGWVSVYAPGSETMLRRLPSNPATRFPDALAFDRAGNLYVANEPYASGGGSVDVYPPQSTTENYSITDGVRWPTALGVNRDGSLYVGNSNLINRSSSSVIEYARGGTSPELTFGTGPPKVIAFDRLDNLYLVSSTGVWANTIGVFAPNSSKQIRSIRAQAPNAVAFDRHGNLYVANGSGTGSVTVYAPGTKSKPLTITTGIADPVALAFDSVGNLYVANQGNNSVTVYAPGKSAVLQKITHAIDRPIALAVGSK